MRIVLDTNVLISSLFGQKTSFPYLLVYNCILRNHKATLCLSEAVKNEYVNVIHYPKFEKYPSFKANGLALLDVIDTITDNFQPTQKINLINDEPDNRILELALVAKADFIVTGNTNDFDFEEFEGTKIISPKDFYLNFCISV